MLVLYCVFFLFVYYFFFFLFFCFFFFFFFFFQAEDGIRDTSVTGVQTCALPISSFRSNVRPRRRHTRGDPRPEGRGCPVRPRAPRRRASHRDGRARVASERDRKSVV